MIVWAEKIYFSENIKEKHRKKLCGKIEAGKRTHDIYCVTYPTNPENILDIISTGELKYPHYKRLETKVVGVAKGKDEAEELVRTIIEDVYTATSGFDVKSFLH